ncbi:MAG TPA: hypothetical protein DGR27_05155 [Eubacterium sp.]|nr:MAG TPA: hypothetical protein [Caudoviricetes sp.]HAS70615.1 hypothetical protein [Eubacterium sp.]HCW37888.1 hypothetical protein [Eubacterium sp.]
MIKKKYKNPATALEVAGKLFARHKRTFKEWPYGEIKEVWPDSKGVMCIMYASGTWFRYDIFAGTWW